MSDALAIDDGLRVEAARALELAALDPLAARSVASAALSRIGNCPSWDIVCVAERALGVAFMNLSLLDEAVFHLRAAVKAGRRVRDGSLLGEAHMSLASALVLHGSRGEALRQIEAALHKLEGLPAARARVQHAAIHQELGNNSAALVSIRSAIPLLRAHGDAEWAARAYSNRSLIHIHRRAFGAAERDLRAALTLCDTHRLELPAAYAEQNLGCLSAQRGDIPAALRHFEAAGRRYAKYGIEEASVLVDRAEALLSVRLLDEARTAAEAAVAAYRRQARDVHLPEAELLLSTVALVQGDLGTAERAAASALTGFRTAGRSGGTAQARYAQIQAETLRAPDGVSLARVARAADDLEAAGWLVPALEAKVLAGRLAIERGRLRLARTYLASASQARGAGPADARARAWFAEAMLRRAQSRRTAALSALRAGIRIVDDYQATLGATELRAHVSVHRGSLARAGLRMALEDRHAWRALWWAERNRASALINRPAYPPEDPELAQHLADLRSTMAEIEEARDSGENADRLLQRQIVIEHRIRDRCRLLTGTVSSERRRALTELPSLLGDRALVEFIELDEQLYAVTMVDRRVRLHALGPRLAVSRALESIPFALRRLARSQSRVTAGTTAATAMLDRADIAVDEGLLRPLRAVLRDRPLVVVPIPALQSVPWSLLPSCAGRPVATSPSATMWVEAATRPAAAGDRAVVVAGPGLPGAAEEAAAVATLYPKAALLQGRSATVSRVTRSMAGADHLHLAAHGTLRGDNPLFSSVLLHDGPLTVYELERLASVPRHVTLAACDTGRHQVVVGAEVLGIAAALLSSGTATLVAPVVSIADAATGPLMRAFHERLVAGSPPAVALADAQISVDHRDPAVLAAAAAFLCLGAG